MSMVRANIAMHTPPQQQQVVSSWTVIHPALGIYIILTFLLFSTAAQQVLFSCDFDTWPCGLILDPSGNFQWLRYNKKPPTEYTGPSGGQGGSTWYFYIESSDPREPNDQARFTTPSLNYIGPICVRFFYYAYGIDVGQLIVYTQVGSNYTVNHLNWWRLMGNQGMGWRYQFVDILINDTNTRVGWDGIRGLGWMGDIAIDTIQIVTGTCVPAVYMPWACDFETYDFCGMRLVSQYGFAWFRWSGASPGTINEPSSAQSGNYFAYMDTAEPLAPGTTAGLESPMILYSGEACVNFWYNINGTTGDRISVYTLNQGQGSPWGSWSWTPQTSQIWITAHVTVILTNNNDRVGFLGVRGNDQYGYIAVDNVNINATRCPADGGGQITTPRPTTSAPITISPTTSNPITPSTPNITNLTPIPWACDFETSDICGMTQMNFVNEVYTRWSGPSNPNGLTGPRGAESGQYYMFLNSTPPRKQGDNALLETPYFAYYGLACVRFWYNMYGPDIGQLSVYTSHVGRNNPWRFWIGNQGAQWQLAQITVNLTYDKVGFLATVGPGPLGQIALDNILITPKSCNATDFTSSDSPPTILTTTTSTTTTSVTTTSSTTSTTTPPFPSVTQYPIVSGNAETDGSSNPATRLALDPTGAFNWTRWTGLTPSGQLSTRIINGVQYPVTGPLGPEEGQYYLYTEATGTYNGEVARLICEGTNFQSGPVQRCLRFYFSMNGFHTGTLRVYARYSGGPPVPVWEMNGDKLIGWFNAAVDLNMTYVTQVGIEGVMTGQFSGDIGLDNVTMTNGQCQMPPPGSVWACSFELSDGSAAWCGMTQGQNVNFDWTMWSGKTPSDETGPTSAYSPPYYLYAEASAPRVPGDVAQVLVPQLYQIGPLCISFAYSMYGFHMGTLVVYTVNSANQMTTLWSLSGDQGNSWHNAAVTVPYQPGVQIGFQAIRGSEFSSDMAIDSIIIINGNCS